MNASDRKKTTRCIYKNLLILIALAVMVRLVLSIPVFSQPARSFACTDASTYHLIARNLLAGNGFTMSTQRPYIPESTVAPGYPYFLAGVYAVFGTSSIAVVLIQLVFHLILLSFLYLFIKKRYGERIALLAGILFTFEFNLALFANQVTTETLYTLFFIPALLMAVRWVEEERWVLVIGTGLLLGAGTLVRPVLLYFGFPLLLYVFLTKFNWRKLAGWVVIILIQAACITPWVTRNRSVFGETFYTTVSSMNLVRYHAAPLKALLEDKTRSQAADEIETRALAHETYSNQARYHKLVGAQARRYLLGHPFSYMGIAALGGVGSLILPLPFHETGVYLGGPKKPPGRSIMVSVVEQLSKGRIISIIKLIWQERLSYYGLLAAVVFFIYVLLHLAKLGFGVRAYVIRGLKDRTLLLFLLAGVYSLALGGLAVMPRFRVPLEPLLVTVAAVGVFYMKKRDRVCG